MILPAQPLAQTTDMIRTLALIACLAKAAYGGLAWDTPSVTVKFALTMTGVGTTAYIPLPIYKDNATKQGYVQYTRPTSPDGYSSLELYGPGEDEAYDPTVTVLYDSTGYIAGTQIALKKDDVENATYDFIDQGFQTWDVTFPNGTTDSYWAIQQFYVSADTLAIADETRIASRDSTKVLQDTDIWVKSFDGELLNISTTTSDFTGSGSMYTKQACIPWMGNHYYYNISTTTDCLAKTISNWFPLTYSERLVGVGFMAFLNLKTGNKYFELPTKSEVVLIVPNASDCFYKMAETPAAITLHTFFVDPAWTMTCVFE